MQGSSLLIEIERVFYQPMSMCPLELSTTDLSRLKLHSTPFQSFHSIHHCPIALYCHSHPHSRSHSHPRCDHILTIVISLGASA